jgi:MATE family multidrug resistance protein
MATMNRQPLFSEQTRRRLHVPVSLLALALPIIASMVSRTLMSFVDFIMVSQLGTEAQAAIMPAGILLFCVISFGMGTVSIVNSFVSQSMGRDRLADCSAYAWQGLYLSLAMGLLIVPVLGFVEPFFYWVGHAPAVRDMEIIYVRIGLYSVGPSVAGVALGSFFNGIHRPMVGFWAALISNGFNALANWTLIFGHFGFEPMGIAGAAWGTALAALLQMIIMLAWMLRPHCHQLYRTWDTWRFDLRRMAGILRYGTPAGVQHVIEILAFAIFTLFLVGRFGTEQLAAHNLAFRFLEVSFMPAVGLGIALNAAVGKAIGQNRRDLARLTVWWGAGFAMAYMGFIALLYVTMGRTLAGLLSDDPVVIDWAARLLLLCAAFQVFDALGITHSFALRGAGDTVWPTVVMTICAATVFLGGGWLMTQITPSLGSLGPWLAATAYVIVLGVTFALRWLFGPWEKFELIKEGPVLADADAVTEG